MILTESGAIPYYSRWRCVDLLGLNSEMIAHDGLSMNVFEEYKPDLIMLFSKGQFGSPFTDDPSRLLPWQYIRNNHFIAIAAIRKYDDAYHYYFAKKSSPLFENIVNSVCNLNEVEYGDLEKIFSNTDIPVFNDTVNDKTQN